MLYIISLQNHYKAVGFPLIHVVIHIQRAKLLKNKPSFSHFHTVIHIYWFVRGKFLHNFHVYIKPSTVRFLLYMVLSLTCKQTVKLGKNAVLTRFLACLRVFSAGCSLFKRHSLCYNKIRKRYAFFAFSVLHKGWMGYEKT